jgi:predicted dehydrogenase
MWRQPAAEIVLGLLNCPLAGSALNLIEQMKTVQIGLVGLDTSHTTAFLEIFNGPVASGASTGARIVAAYRGGSPDIEASASRIDRFTRIAVEQYGLKLYDSVEELAANVDAVMILSVDGRVHLEQFRRVAGLGKPVFIDKPLGGTLAQAREIVALAAATKTPCFSSSSMRYAPGGVGSQMGDLGRILGAVSIGPAPREPHHPDLFWYGIHAVEALYTVLGAGCTEVARTSTAFSDVITGVWADGRTGTLQVSATGTGYSVTVIGEKGLATGGHAPGYHGLAAEILTFFRTGVSPVPLELTLEIHAFMAAADESKRRGGQSVGLDEVMGQARNASLEAMVR